MIYFHRTRAGRVVYKRKPHTFTTSDLVRLAMRVKPGGDEDIARLGVALIFIEMTIEIYSFGQLNFNLEEVEPEFYLSIQRQGVWKWATDFHHKHLEESEMLYLFLETWKARSVQRYAERAAQALRISELQDKIRVLEERVAYWAAYAEGLQKRINELTA